MNAKVKALLWLQGVHAWLCSQAIGVVATIAALL